MELGLASPRRLGLCGLQQLGVRGISCAQCRRPPSELPAVETALLPCDAARARLAVPRRLEEAEPAEMAGPTAGALPRSPRAWRPCAPVAPAMATRQACKLYDRRANQCPRRQFTLLGAGSSVGPLCASCR